MIADYISIKFRKDILLNSLRVYIHTQLTSFTFFDATPIEDVRYNVSPSSIDDYYKVLEEKIHLVNYKFFFNIDETGEDEFIDTHKIRVLIRKTTDTNTVRLPVSRKQKRFTIIHTICTDGTYTDLYIVIPRLTIESDLYTIIDKDKVRIVFQKNGFVTTEIFADFWKCLMKQIRQKRIAESYVGLALIIMDNHIAHRKAVGADPDKKVTFVAEENLLIIWLVPHASDQTQPLDLGIFSVHKRETQKQKRTTYTQPLQIQ